MKAAVCAVGGCNREAEYEVILYDFYPADGTVFFETDLTCPAICRSHAIENEAGANGVRQPRGAVVYPYTNRNRAQGFTIYRPISEAHLSRQFGNLTATLAGDEPTIH